MSYHTEQVDLPIISGDINVKHIPGEELTSTDEVYPSVRNRICPFASSWVYDSRELLHNSHSVSSYFNFVCR